MNTFPRKLDFLPYVEGMRALAILLVVAAHAGVPGMAGGVVGVDVFFVISGYLITALLTIEQAGNGRIDFLSFYARRLRRLLPALLLVLATTGLLGAMLIPRTTHPETALAGASAALWLSNIHFAIAEVGYFDVGAGDNPFLHTWSLGVEEQFYLLWPLLILVTARYWQTAFAILAALSLAAFLWLIATPDAATDFYLMPTRIWQFAMGALVWLYPRQCEGKAQSFSSVAIAGWVLILLAAISPDTHPDHPQWRSLAASVGAALLLMAGADGQKHRPTIRVLQAAPMQALGRVSYAWYLWHWPVLVLGQIYFAEAPLATRLLLALFAWALAVLTQRFVEAPVRAANGLLARPGRFILAALVAMLIATFAFYRWHLESQAWREVETEKNRYQAVRWDLPALYAHDCDDWYHSANLKICRFGAPEGKRTAVVVGDSVGLHWFPALEMAFASRGWSLLVITKSSCPVLVDVPFHYERIKREFTECAEWRVKAFEAVAERQPDMVIIGSSFGYGFDEAQWTQGTRRMLERLSPVADRLVLMRATPTLPFDPIECLTRRANAADTSCVADWQDARNADVWRWVGTAASGFSNVEMLDLNGLVCPDGHCVAEKADGVVVYRDKLHLTARFTASLAHSVGEQMGLRIAEE